VSSVVHASRANSTRRQARPSRSNSLVAARFLTIPESARSTNLIYLRGD
jgi:hypothetical protein